MCRTRTVVSCTVQCLGRRRRPDRERRRWCHFLKEEEEEVEGVCLPDID